MAVLRIGCKVYQDYIGASLIDNVLVWLYHSMSQVYSLIKIKSQIKLICLFLVVCLFLASINYTQLRQDITKQWNFKSKQQDNNCF